MTRTEIKHVQDESGLELVSELLTGARGPHAIDKPLRDGGHVIAYTSGERDSDEEIAVVLMSSRFARAAQYATARREILDSMGAIFATASIQFVTTTPDIIRRLYLTHDSASDITTGATSATSDEILDRLRLAIRAASHRNASDIHILVSRSGSQALLRIDGRVHHFEFYSHEEGMEMVRAAYQTQIETGSGQGEFNPYAGQDAKLIVRVPLAGGRSREVQLRYAHYPSHDGLHAVMRLSSDSRLIATDLRSLGYYPGQAALIERTLLMPGGLTVFSGPVGSGKTTALAALLSHHLQTTQRRVTVLTIEDPVEILITGAVQSSVIRDSKHNASESPFGPALLSCLRRDPDVILLGETRDRYTGRAVSDAVLSGHKIYTTTHAGGAWAIIDRFDGLGGAQRDNPLSRSRTCRPEFFGALIYQQLAPLLCPTCAVPSSEAAARGIDDALRQRAGDALRATFGDDADGQIAFRGSEPDCPQCRGTGTRGRVVCAEVVLPTAKQFRLLAAGETSEAIAIWRHDRNPAAGFGMRSHEIALHHISLGALCPRDYETLFQPLESRPDISAARPARLMAAG